MNPVGTIISRPQTVSRRSDRWIPPHRFDVRSGGIGPFRVAYRRKRERRDEHRRGGSARNFGIRRNPRGPHVYAGSRILTSPMIDPRADRSEMSILAETVANAN